MTRLIDADALDWGQVENEYGRRNPSVVACEILIDNAPTIDAVEIVRCKDCKYGDEDYPKDIFPDATEETYSCERSTYSHDKDFYCKYGKRRDDTE